jgi:hypothetical protein
MPNTKPKTFLSPKFSTKRAISFFVAKHTLLLFIRWYAHVDNIVFEKVSLGKMVIDWTVVEQRVVDILVFDKLVADKKAFSQNMNEQIVFD